MTSRQHTESVSVFFKGLGCSMSFFVVSRMISFAFYNNSGKAHVDPKAFQAQKYVKPVQRGRVIDVTPCQPIKRIVYTSVLRQIMKLIM